MCVLHGFLEHYKNDRIFSFSAFGQLRYITSFLGPIVTVEDLKTFKRFPRERFLLGLVKCEGILRPEHLCLITPLYDPFSWSWSLGLAVKKFEYSQRFYRDATRELYRNIEQVGVNNPKNPSAIFHLFPPIGL